MTALNCPICIERITPVLRKQISCPYCPFSACRLCTSQYLLNTTSDPHCMGCKREWNREFMDLNLTQTFRKGPLKEHRRKILIDREMALLPSIQVYAEATKVRNEEGIRFSVLTNEKQKIKAEMKMLKASVNENGLVTLASIEPLLITLIEKKNGIKRELRAAAHLIHDATTFLRGKGKVERREFIMKCPGENCRGFLSSAWNCGVCKGSFCHECHEAKSEAHECNPDTKATTALIRKSSKPCPRCGINIHKIEGCSQIFCTSCECVWDYGTGLESHNAVIHNPHYFEYIKQRGGLVARELGDIPCGGLPNTHHFYAAVVESGGFDTSALRIYRYLAELSEFRIMRFPLRRGAQENRELDISYILGYISADFWGSELEREETKFGRNKEIGLILQTVLHVGSEKCTEFMNTKTPETLLNFLSEMEDIRFYTNKSLIEKGILMDIVVPRISSVWTWGSTRKSDMKDYKSGKKPIPSKEDNILIVVS